MIKGVHAMFYTPRADELRAFLRDQLGLPFVDTGGGWLTHFNPPGGGEVELYQPKYSTDGARPA